MAWEWSHTEEAYFEAERQLQGKSAKWIAECYAEWRCCLIKKYFERFDHLLEEVEGVIEEEEGADVRELRELADSLNTDPYTDGRYEEFVKEARKACKDGHKEAFVNQVWEWASGEYGRTCETGGWALWMCPDGCHTISV